MPEGLLRPAIGRIAGQTARTVEDGQRVIAVAVHGDGEPDEMAAVPLARDLQGPALEAHAVVGTDPALELLAQDVVEPVADPGDKGRAAAGPGRTASARACRPCRRPWA